MKPKNLKLGVVITAAAAALSAGCDNRDMTKAPDPAKVAEIDRFREDELKTCLRYGNEDTSKLFAIAYHNLEGNYSSHKSDALITIPGGCGTPYAIVNLADCSVKTESAKSTKDCIDSNGDGTVDSVQSTACKPGDKEGNDDFVSAEERKMCEGRVRKILDHF